MIKTERTKASILYRKIIIIQYLVSFQKGLSSSHILGKLLWGHQSSDAINPWHQISVKEEILQPRKYQKQTVFHFHSSSSPEQINLTMTSNSCAHLKSERKRCKSWELPSLSLRWSARPTRLLQAVLSSVHFSWMSSTASGWDWMRRSAVSPREFTWAGEEEKLGNASRD